MDQFSHEDEKDTRKPHRKFNHFLYKRFKAVRSSEHVHINDAKEITPWLAASIRLNPHNVRAFLITSFWVDKKLGKPDEAERILREGLRYNRRNWQLHYELGRLYATRNKPDQALNYYIRALDFFPVEQQEDNKLELSSVLRSLAAVFKEKGDPGRAAAVYQKIMEINPTEETVNKLKSLLNE